MDELITQLQQKGTGCWIGQHFYGSVAYADDLTLLSPTAAGLQSLLSVCEKYSHEYGMTYNSSKSHCVLFTRKKKAFPNLLLNGQTLKWEQQAKHLGNFLYYDLSEKQDVRMKRSDLVGRVNTIVGSLHQLTPDIIAKMFASQCCHYYGTQTWQFSSSTLGDFSTMWNRCVRRLLNLPNKTHRRFLPHLVSMKSPSDQICKGFLSLYQTMKNSENDSVKFLAIRGTDDARSIISRNLHFICKSYQCPAQDISDLKGLAVTSYLCSDEDLCAIEVIRDIIDHNLDSLYSKHELSDYLNSVCIN